MAELDSKGWRVAGFFIFMLGAGLVLESGAIWCGAAMICVGALCFGWGVASGKRRPGASA